jgi:glycosyltransferase involved in cell wall biosynthesis
MQKKILIIIPAYNESLAIQQVIGEVRSKAAFADIVVIDDGSQDDTYSKARSLGVSIVSLPVNLGIGGAVQTGFKYAFAHGYDIALQVDGDGQHDPQFAADLIQPILENQADMVIGSRFLHKQGFQSTFWRRCGIQVFHWLYHCLLRINITDGTSGFRAYNKKTIEFLCRSYPRDFPEPEAVILLAKKGFRIKEIPVLMRARVGSVSSISGFKPLYYMVKVVFSILIEYWRD